jgi:hypothetical protein
MLAITGADFSLNLTRFVLDELRRPAGPQNMVLMPGSANLAATGHAPTVIVTEPGDLSWKGHEVVVLNESVTIQKIPAQHGSATIAPSQHTATL